MSEGRSEDRLERWIELFFVAREADAELTPEAFLGRHPDAPAALADALGTAVDLAGMLRADADTPRRVGPYSVVRELGRGAMAVVYEVEHNGARAALKVLPPWDAASEHTRARFAREALALRRLHHRGLARVLDAGGDGGSPWLVMELVAGPSLASLQGPLPPLRAADLVADLAEAAAAAHASGVVHRDIKPSNVLLRDDGAPVLVDFGLAALADDAGLTGSGDVLGTPRYMSPEQAAGQRGDEQSDVYALGLVLYELLTGRPARGQSTRAEALRAARRGDVERLPKSVPVALRAVVGKALALRRHRRYPHARDMAADLRAFGAGRRVRTRAPGPVAHAVDALRGHRGLRLAATGVAVGLIVATGWWWQTRARSRAETARYVDLAMAAYLVGTDSAARAMAERGLQVADDVMLRSLCAALGPTPAVEPLGAALVALRSQPAAAAASWARLDHGLAPVLRAQALLLAGDAETAAAAVNAVASSAAAPLCLRITRAQVRARHGDVGGAVATLVPADLVPADPENRVAALVLSVTRARLALAQGDLDSGLRAARAGARLGDAEPRGLTGLLVDILESAPDRPALRAVLARAAANEPDDPELGFALAYSFDVDHAIAAAAAEYVRVLQHAPEHARTLVCLAHLRNGAERDTCAACATAFAAHPELLDRAAAGQLALRGLAAGGTRDVAVLDAGARVAMAAGATTQLSAWLATARAPGGALAERLGWWQRRCQRAGR